jgi:hypothetical protein
MVLLRFDSVRAGHLMSANAGGLNGSTQYLLQAHAGLSATNDRWRALIQEEHRPV